MHDEGLPPADDSLALLAKILKAESRLKFQNESVFGGFDRFIEKHLRQVVKIHPDLAGPMERVARALDDYRRLGTRERRDRVAEAETEVEAAQRGASPVPVPLPLPARPRRPSPTPPPLNLDTPVEAIAGVGPKRGELLRLLGIRVASDLLRHRPLRYVDRSSPTPLADLEADRAQTFKAAPSQVRGGIRFGPPNTTAVLDDGPHQVRAVWFHQPYVAQRLEVGRRYLFHGMLKAGKLGLEVHNADFEPEDEPGARAIVPVYPSTEGLHQKTLQRLVDQVLPLALELHDPLPERLRIRRELVGYARALTGFHRPESMVQTEESRRRLAYDELLALQLGLQGDRRRRLHQESGAIIPLPDRLGEKLEDILGFDLTGAQQRAIREILTDLAATAPMARLLQGDVGAGKTLVAVASMLAASGARFQSALMAPTEILAEQHFFGLRDVVAKLGVRVKLLTGSTPKRERRRTVTELFAGMIDAVVGTHALLSEDVTFRNLGLVVIDEQHRFGVVQRDLLLGKGRQPNLLVMTATPIPRTLSLALYGDLDQSILDEMPRGRGKITTRWIFPDRLEATYASVRAELDRGRQAFVVCPLVEESDEVDRADAVSYHALLSEGPFAGYRVGLLHGQLDWNVKQQVMEDFRHGRLDLVVCTTVVEVGIDVPNATVMLIMDAGGFGMAQLHQLRGRIGRGEHPSTCYLVHPEAGGETAHRLRTLVQSQDGFVIAEADLALRGPGELFGTRQAGLTDMQVADLSRDLDLLRHAHGDARELLEADPDLASPENAGLAKLVFGRMNHLRRH